MHNVLPALQSFLVPINSLVGALVNPRTHSIENLKDIKSSLETFGQDQLIVVRKANNEIIKGNGRWTGMKELGWTECAAVFVDDDELKAMARGIADNRSSETSDWDNELLLRELKLIEPTDFADSTGFSLEEIKALAESLGQSIDQNEKGRAPFETADVSALTEKWNVKVGKTWNIGQHRLICADPTDPQAVANVMRDDKASMVFGDFPDDHDAEYIQRVLANIIRYSIDKWTGYLLCNDQYLRRAANAYALRLGHPIVWIRKEKKKTGEGFYQKGHEFIYVLGKGYGLKERWFGSTSESGTWNINSVKSKIDQIPVELPERAIRNSSQEGETVLDLFGGVGATMMASHLNNRKCISIEFDLAHCAMILERMSQIVEITEADYVSYPIPDAPELWQTIYYNLSDSQARIVNEAIKRVSQTLDGNNLDARALELICADYLAGN